MSTEKPLNKTTLVVGASTNPERYAYKAIMQLRANEHTVLAYGFKKRKRF
jgi:hypothetical protein